MFRRLHRQMTAFCSAVTGAILIGLSIACLLFAKKAMMQTTYTGFQKELGILLTSLQSQEYISHQWLRQMQDEHHFTIFLYDNGEPLYYEKLQKNRSDELADAVLAKAGWDIFKTRDGMQTLHEEFSFHPASGLRCYASVGYLSRGKGLLSFVILYDIAHQTAQLAALTWFIVCADIVTLFLLVLFSWYFTGRMLLPLETSRKKQQQFVADASHELRSPLAVMLSGLESVAKADSAGERAHFLSLILKEGQRMQHLISDMLTLANADAHGMRLHLTEWPPDDLLLAVFEKYEPLAASKKLSLKLLLLDDADYAVCRADRERVEQLLAIFMDNAISYTPAGGKILLSLTQRTGRTIFSAADNGPSVPDAQKKHIFERFYRADSAHTDHEHYGLGLCTAQEIAKAHRGKITVSDPRHCGFLPKDLRWESGAVFSFYL